MRLRDALKIQEYLDKGRLKIRHAKGHDYSSEEDCLLNFKVVAELARLLKVDITKSYGVAMLHKLHKLQRESNLVYGHKKPKNESVVESIVDGLNYDNLRLECYIDEGVIVLEIEE